VSDAKKQLFERLVAPWRDDLFRYVMWLCRDPALADDVVQETMIRAFKAIDTLADERVVKSWLLTIARREHARTYERKRVATRSIDALTQTESAFIASGHDTDVEDMRRAIFALDEEYREPLVLQVLLGLTTQEIADTMNIKQGAVLTRLHRARKKLIGLVRPELAALEADDDAM
jgi:RNA polymerase sigma-70 factor (ECF subfamily)